MKQLRATGLVKSYRRRRVVDGVSVEVNPGEVVGLLGPNGAGKTTSFNMVVGIVPPDGGKIMLGDKDLAPLPLYMRARLGMGYLPQEPSVFRGLTVLQNFMCILEHTEKNVPERKKRAEQLIDEFNLGHVRDNLGGRLSGGERRRTEIARALIPRPSHLLFDEPFAGIDPIAVKEIQKLVSALKDKGIGVLITDHNVRETLGIVDRAYIINAGSILEAGSPEHIAKSELARKVYLGEGFTLS
ncbi:MAG: LPS export ABC transporter ATP-binding protein [Deltaproteobacteria bacterium]|nr:LPS export ABC transporter ATP-binding protein [Deltaproteobacteria bacterium]